MRAAGILLMAAGAYVHLAGVCRIAWLDQDPTTGWKLLAAGTAAAILGAALLARSKGRSLLWALSGALGAPGLVAMLRLRYRHEVEPDPPDPLGPQHEPRFTGVCPWCDVPTAVGAAPDGELKRIVSGCGAAAIGADRDDRDILAAAAARWFGLSNPAGMEERDGGWAWRGVVLRFRWYRSPGATTPSACRLAQAEARAEEGYDRMYRSDGRVILGDVTDDFLDAIRIARELGLPGEAGRLEKRMNQVRGIIRSQSLR